MNIVQRIRALGAYCTVAERKNKAVTSVCDELFKEFKFYKQFMKTADMTNSNTNGLTAEKPSRVFKIPTRSCFIQLTLQSVIFCNVSSN